MDGLNRTRYVFALAMLLMPASYTMKYFLGDLEITWVDPTLILGAVAFLLVGYRARNGWSGAVLAYAFLAALVGSMYLAPSLDREKAPLYVIFVEPIRLALNLAWFWVCIEYWKKSRPFTLRWLSISAIVQFSIALYFYLVMLELLPAPDLVALYLSIYKTRQAIWIGGIPVYRMAGTFFESPAFGLFMISSFVVLALELLSPREPYKPGLRRLVAVGAALSLLGSIASLSDQVLLALVVLAVAFLLYRVKESSVVQALVWAGIGLPVALFAGSQLLNQWRNAGSAASEVYGHSVGERLFHCVYSLKLFMEQPAALITGIGPGRYGDYVSRIGVFESTVVPGVTVVEWMVEWGIVGLAIIVCWLNNIARRAAAHFGQLGVAAVAALLIANMFQMNWKMESWFMAMAYLYTTTPEALTVPVPIAARPSTGGTLARARV
jgi:hypothetical protein